MTYFADADGSGTGNGCIKLLRSHCDADGEYATLSAARCESYGNGKWYPTERSFAPDCARGEIWERIEDAELATPSV
jgi:hypothetical protein